MNKRMARLILFVACGFLFALLLAAPTAAQEPVTDDEVNAVANKLYCPTCESVPVDVCPTQTCADWRELIRQQLAEGRSEEEILNYFAERFGRGVLVNPPREGYGLVAWIAPIVIVLGGILIFGRYFMSLQAGQEGPPEVEEAPAPTDSEGTADAYRARLEEELRRDSF